MEKSKKEESEIDTSDRKVPKKILQYRLKHGRHYLKSRTVNRR